MLRRWGQDGRCTLGTDWGGVEGFGREGGDGGDT